MLDSKKRLKTPNLFWRKFRQERLGYASFCILVFMLVVSVLAPVLSNDKPLVIGYENKLYFPILKDYPETTFGGDFPTEADYLDPFVQKQLTKGNNWVVYPPNRYGAHAVNYFAKSPNPSQPTLQNWLGTDDRGRDVLAQLIYGFRVSIFFALALTAVGVCLGIAAGAIQGYFAGRIDLWGQRLLEIWSSMPELYLLIIFSSIFTPSIGLLLLLLALFSWMGLSDYVRAEFLRNRQLDYVKSAKALGASHWLIIWRHILPNSLTPVITFLPFRMSAAIVALTSLDFLGLGVPPGTPSLGELLNQGKANLDAWWISIPTFLLLTITLLLLTLMGDGLRNAFDPRKYKIHG